MYMYVYICVYMHMYITVMSHPVDCKWSRVKNCDSVRALVSQKFWMACGAFWNVCGPFWVYVGLFWVSIGLFWVNVGFLWVYVGLFCVCEMCVMTPLVDCKWRWGKVVVWRVRPRWSTMTCPVNVTWLIHMCDMTHVCELHDASPTTLEYNNMPCESDMTHSYVWHDSCIWVTWRFHICDMTRWNVSHDGTWLIHMCDITHVYQKRDGFRCVIWLIDMCHITGHDAFIWVTWLVYLSDVTYSYLQNDSLICVILRFMTHSYVWCNVSCHVGVPQHDLWEGRDSFVCVTWRDMTHAYVCDMTHSYVWHASLTCV